MTYDPGQGVQAQGDLRDVPPLEQVRCLEDLLVGDAVFTDGGLEPATNHGAMSHMSQSCRAKNDITSRKIETERVEVE